MFMQGHKQNHIRMADRLLCYTDLGMADVSKRTGFGSANNLYLTYRREFGITSGGRRQMIRKERNVERCCL